jgi:hypothetical protein
MGPTFFNTTATGDFASLPDYDGATVHLLNNSGADLEIRRKGQVAAGNVFVLKNGQAWSIRSVTNADQIEIKGSGTVHGEVDP